MKRGKGLEGLVVWPVVIGVLTLGCFLSRAYVHRQERDMASIYTCSGVLASGLLFAVDLAYVWHKRNSREREDYQRLDGPKGI